MRYFLTFLLIISFIFSCRSKIKMETGALTVGGKYCKYPNNDFIVLPFQLFKNGVHVQSDTLKFSRVVKFKDLSFGKYTIKFKSIYNHQEMIDVALNSKTQKIVLCIDQIDYNLAKDRLFIDELKPNEKLKIHFDSSGCFDFEEASLEITRTGKQYLAKINETQIVLSDFQIKLLREFEIELREIPTRFCTTTDTYNLHILNTTKNIKLIDESCSWYGFKNLLLQLKLDKNFK